MKNIYYLIWVDGIVNSKDYKKKDPAWKISIFWLLTFLNALNIATVILWLNFFQLITYKVEINIFGSSLLNNIMEGFLAFVLPVAILNYFFIFYNQRYKRLIDRTNHYKGRLAMSYTITSLLLLCISMIIT